LFTAINSLKQSDLYLEQILYILKYQKTKKYPIQNICRIHNSIKNNISSADARFTYCQLCLRYLLRARITVDKYLALSLTQLRKSHCWSLWCDYCCDFGGGVSDGAYGVAYACSVPPHHYIDVSFCASSARL
jgi:hypothetical protein